MRERILRAFRTDPDVVLYAARVSVRMRWLLWVCAAAALAYRPGLWYDTDKQYLLLLVPLAACNGVVHRRLRAGRPVTWRWLFWLSVIDIALITATVAIGGKFHLFVYVTYYPALALFAVVFTSLWLCLAWATVTGVAYGAVSLGAGSGLDFGLAQEKALAARIAAMYGVVACVSLIAHFERARREESAQRERALHAERVELSRAIHDTSAQSAYLIGLGIERAAALAEGSNDELASTLAATLSLSKMAMWELRRPIDAGLIFEGRQLGRVLRSHTETFAKITAIPAKMSQSGTEPPLPTHMRAGVFSIAHNALANAFLHSKARTVHVTLNFEAHNLRLCVADDGIGLPEDFDERGRGFPGMRADAERLGGKLIVDTGGRHGGTSVTCCVPYKPS